MRLLLPFGAILWAALGWLVFLAFAPVRAAAMAVNVVLFAAGSWRVSAAARNGPCPTAKHRWANVRIWAAGRMNTWEPVR